MEEKLFNFRRFALVLGALLFFASYFVEGTWHIVFLVVALVGLLLVISSVVKKSSSTTKMLYWMFIFLLLSNLATALGLQLISTIFSLAGFILAFSVILKVAIYVNKHCRRDADDHLDEL